LKDFSKKGNSTFLLNKQAEKRKIDWLKRKTMRLRQEEIDYTVWQVLRRLKESGQIVLLGSEEDLLEHLRKALTKDLMVEDLLNREVDDILRAHQSEIERESVDYRRMFQLIKNKLVKERGLIL
jgi:hypothetical protein